MVYLGLPLAMVSQLVIVPVGFTSRTSLWLPSKTEDSAEVGAPLSGK